MASLCKNLRLARRGANYMSHRLGALRTFSSNRQPLKTRPHLQVKPQFSISARSFATRAFHSIEIGDDGEPLLVTKMKKKPPAHYMVEIDSFEKFDRFEIDYLEAGEFEAGGYKWSLRIYQDLHWYEKGSKVPVILALADTSALPEHWEFDAVVSICWKYINSESYFSVLGRAHFDATKTEWRGFVFNKYLQSWDTRVFGAEVFVNKKDLVTEHVTLKYFKHPPYKQEFKIPNFPSLKEDGGWVPHQVWTSQVFSATGREWKLKVCPKRWGDSAGHLTIVVENLPPINAHDYTLVDVKAYYTITLKSRREGFDVKHTCSSRNFKSSGGGQSECVSLIDLASLHDPDKFFITDDCVHLELELVVDDDDDSKTSSTYTYVPHFNATKTGCDAFIPNHLVKDPNYKQKFSIPNFPSLTEDGGWVTQQTWTSQVFSAGGHQWKLKVSPMGWEEGEGRLSIFLEKIVDSIKPSNTHASYTITLKSDYGDHVKYTCTGEFSELGGNHGGRHSFIDLVTLNDPDKGYIEDDCVQIELELYVDEDDSIPSSISDSP